MRTFATCMMLLFVVVAVGCGPSNTAEIRAGYENTTPVPAGSEPVSVGGGGGDAAPAATAPPPPMKGK